MTILPITPLPKPRMTKSDRWKKRPCVVRYWAYKDELNRLAKENNFTIPESGMHVTFYLPMPKSWPKKKQKVMCGKPHQQKPDGDNIFKGFLDCLTVDDSYIWDMRITKRWSEIGYIEIKEI